MKKFDFSIEIRHKIPDDQPGSTECEKRFEKITSNEINVTEIYIIVYLYSFELRQIEKLVKLSLRGHFFTDEIYLRKHIRV